jgi:O-acetyl-ADP-ribose deacetylase (regulator of RNase III)
MISKAFYKPSVPPELIYRSACSTGRRAIEVWVTSCIVHKTFPKFTQSSILINPSNPELSGTSNFPYFPKGGPVPAEKVKSMHKDWQPLGHVSYWGSMNTGDGILFPVSVVDGLVHELGGWRLGLECRWKQWMSRPNGGQPCPVGEAVVTLHSGPELEYDQIVHTTPPFYNYTHQHEDKNNNDNNNKTQNHHQLLQDCYRNALSLAFDTQSDGQRRQRQRQRRVACPLLGAGARGFPTELAIQIAAEQTLEWQLAKQPQQRLVQDDYDCSKEQQDVLAFGLLEHAIASQLAERLDATTYDDTR